MKLLATAAIITAVVAAPAETVESRQGCTYGFVFARGSTEPSPIGITVGPGLQSALRTRLPGFKTYPVKYAASVSTNVSVQRTDNASINKSLEAFRSARGCKVIIAGGYSQGAAVMVRSVPKLDADIKSKIAAVALFGSTLNKQYGGHIPGFPNDKSRTWCNKSDGVCGGGLTVNVGHLSYNSAQYAEAASWMAGKAKAAGRG